MATQIQISEPEKQEKPLYTEGGNAQRLLAAHAQDLRYCHAKEKWYVWNHVRWEIDPDGDRVISRMKSVMHAMRQAAKNALTPLRRNAAAIRAEKFTVKGDLKADQTLTEGEQRVLETYESAQEDLDWAIKSDSKANTYGSVTMAKDVAEIRVEAEDFDADPYTFNCENGTMDLKTGMFYSHIREDMCSRVAPVAYDPKAVCPQFVETLNLMYDDDQETIAYLQAFFGIALTGRVTPDIIILLGSGRNGKTTIVQAIAGVLGSSFSVKKKGYATQAAAATFVQSKWGEQGGSARSDVRSLDGARLVHSAEYTRKFTLDMGLLKALTGGETKPSRDLWEGQTEFTPQCSIVILSNEQPIIPDATEGTWARLRNTPCDGFIADKLVAVGRSLQLDFHKVLIKQEASGILNWLLAGCKLALAREAAGAPLLGTVPERIVKATEEYRKQQSQVVKFVAERCILRTGLKIDRTKLYEEFCRWCRSNGEDVVDTQKGFATTLMRDFPELRPPDDKEPKDRITRRAIWKGIGLTEDSTVGI